MYTVHLTLIEKRVVDFLLVIIERFFAVSEILRSIGPKSLYSATPRVFNKEGRGFPGMISVKFYLDVSGWPRYQMA